MLRVKKNALYSGIKEVVKELQFWYIWFA